MPRAVINTRKMLPPFPFLIWNQEAITSILKHKGFNLNECVTRRQLEEGAVEYCQGKDEENAPKE